MRWYHPILWFVLPLLSCNGGSAGALKDPFWIGRWDHLAVMWNPAKRLNLVEYNNTLQSLLGVSNTMQEQFPPDPINQGFDNIAGSLPFSPQLLSLFLQANEQAVRHAFQDQPRFFLHQEAETIGGMGSMQDGWGFKLDGQMRFTFNNPMLETITLSIEAAGSSFGQLNNMPAPLPRLRVRLDNTVLDTVEVDASIFALKTFRFTFSLPPGAHTLLLEHTNYVTNTNVIEYANPLIINWIELASEAKGKGSGFALLQDCASQAFTTDVAQKSCYLDSILLFASRAFRRRLSEEEQQQLVTTWDKINPNGGTLEDNRQAVMRAILSSPNFMLHSFRRGDPAEQPGMYWLQPEDLANRLSFLLYGSPADSELMKAAQAGDLYASNRRHAWIERMLQDPKSVGFIQGFAAQWLGTRAIKHVQFNSNNNTGFSNELLNSMVNETETLFTAILTNKQPLTTLLDTDETYVDDTLARHYGLPLPGSNQPTRIALRGARPGGFLAHSGWLMTYSNLQRTSPVRRGKFLLEHLLCETIDPPPPGVPLFEPILNDNSPTVREQLEAHTKNPICKSCHQSIDPLGFGVEIYDPLGRVRQNDRNRPINDSGVFPKTLLPFQGNQEMVRAFSQDVRFTNCAAKKLFTYALGRNLTPADEPTLNELITRWEQTDRSIVSLLYLITDTPQFLWQPGE